MTDTIDIDVMVDGSAHTAPLDADAIPNDNQSHTCFSCHEPLGALYCGSCGQKNDDYRRSLWSLGAEAIMSLTALESRIWRTWAVLFVKPGKVAREFADGRRTHWSSPVRVYIFMSIALFFFMEATGTLFFALEGRLTPKDGIEKPAAELTVEDVGWSVQPHVFPTQAMVGQWNEDLDFDLFNAVLDARSDGAAEAFADFGEGGYLDPSDLLDTLMEGDVAPTPENLATLDDAIAGLRKTSEDDGLGIVKTVLAGTLTELETERDAFAARVAERESANPESEEQVLEGIPRPSDSVTDDREGMEAANDQDRATGDSRTFLDGFSAGTSGTNLDGNTFLNDMITNPGIVNNALNRWLPRIVFLMMPLTMLISAMFIRGLPRRARRKDCPRGERHALLYDHLVHATYIHAVAYAMLFMGIIVSRVFPGSGGTVAGILTLLMMIYLPLSLRRMFRRGWFKTVWTSYGVAFIHFLIVTVLMSWVIGVALAEHFGTA